MTRRAPGRVQIALAAAVLATAAGALPGPALAQAASGVGWGLLQPASAYLRASQLDARAAPLGDIEPVPPKGSESRVGRVVARILINESGRADRVLIEASEPRGLFDRSVVDAFGAARYRPGMKAGAPVKSQIRVEVRFAAEARAAR
jgi:TonB family protein